MDLHQCRTPKHVKSMTYASPGLRLTIQYIYVQMEGPARRFKKNVLHDKKKSM
eukprot:COSAG01_NODE_10_length_42970_cov_93.010007_56_plen_53_part_00